MTKGKGQAYLEAARLGRSVLRLYLSSWMQSQEARLNLLMRITYRFPNLSHKWLPRSSYIRPLTAKIVKASSLSPYPTFKEENQHLKTTCSVCIWLRTSETTSRLKRLNLSQPQRRTIFGETSLLLSYRTCRSDLRIFRRQAQLENLLKKEQS